MQDRYGRLLHRGENRVRREYRILRPVAQGGSGKVDGYGRAEILLALRDAVDGTLCRFPARARTWFEEEDHLIFEAVFGNSRRVVEQLLSRLHHLPSRAGADQDRMAEALRMHHQYHLRRQSP